MTTTRIDLDASAVLVLAALGAGAVFLIWARSRLASIGEISALDVGTGAARAATDAASGIVLGIGDAIGLPRPSETECQRALAEGRLWDASFACPAQDFLRAAWHKLWSDGGSPAGSRTYWADVL